MKAIHVSIPHIDSLNLNYLLVITNENLNIGLKYMCIIVDTSISPKNIITHMHNQ